MTAALELHDITAGYRLTTVLRDVSLTVPAGSIVALPGPNGAGKTTLLRTAAGVLRPARGEVLISGDDVTRSSSHVRARRGLCLIPEGRGVFPSLTVRENLRLQIPPWMPKDGAVDAALSAFPPLAQRLSQVAGSMSGGEQQMLALARAYIARPKVVLLDEVSMGLAPRVIDSIFSALRVLAESGAALLIVEQYVARALEITDLVYLLNMGRITYSGTPADLDERTILRGYLGQDQSADGVTGE